MKLPDGYLLRPTRIDDAESAAATLAAVELADTGKTDITTESILRDWSWVDLAEESAVVVTSNGVVAGLVDVVNLGYTAITVYAFVHPEHRCRGIGRTLVEWGEQWTRDRLASAPADARVVVRHFMRSTNHAGLKLLASAGYEPVRTTYVMEMDLPVELEQPVWPGGVRSRTFRPGQDEHAVWETIEDSFRDLWGRPQVSFEQFMERLEGGRFAPELWILAEDGDQLAGVSICEEEGDQGIVRTLGVRRPWRKQGLGLALLNQSFCTFRQRGLRRAWLSVDADSPTGAPRLYSRAGMEVTESHILHIKEIRPGVDYSQFQEA